VSLRHGELLAKGDLLGGSGPKGHAQEVAEAGDHPLGRVGILPDEGHDRVESIEEEVGVQLHPQCFELGLGQSLLQFEGPGLAIDQALVVVPCVGDAQDRPVDESVPMESDDV